MSSARYATPLRLEIRPSRQLAAGIVVIYGGGASLIWLLPWAWWWCAAVAVLVGVAGIRAGAVHLWGGQAIDAAIWASDGAWVLQCWGGDAMCCRLLPGGYVHPRLTVLRFDGEVRRSLVLLPDALDPAQFRRLRVRLALEGGE